MKILLISDVYFPRVNGVSTSIRTFTEQLQSLGHTVHLITPDYGVETVDEDGLRACLHAVFILIPKIS